MGRENSQNYPLWHLLAMTGMRRGEALALRWRDVGPRGGDAQRAPLGRHGPERWRGRRRRRGRHQVGKPRVIDLDEDAVSVLRAHRKARGAMALQLVAPGSLVFGDLEGAHRNPEHVSRQFGRDVERCGQVPGVEASRPAAHHATILLTAREPVHVVSQRLGHASAVVTMTVYAHVLPGSQREAAGTFARLVREAPEHEGIDQRLARPDAP